MIKKNLIIFCLWIIIFAEIGILGYDKFIKPWFIKKENFEPIGSLIITKPSITPVVSPTLIPNLTPIISPIPTKKKITTITEIGYTGTWGVATQIDEHTWTMKIGEDEQMGNAEEILLALNEYRRIHGSQALTMNQSLKDYAVTRAEFFVSNKGLDGHKGFMNFLENEDGYNKLGFNWVGENASFGYKVNGTHLIEWLFAGDKDHDANQLDSKWDNVGIGVKNTAVCLIFATSKR